MPTFETNEPIVLSIELSRGAVHVLASHRRDTVVAVNPGDPDRPDDVEAAAKTLVDLADGTLFIRQPSPPAVAAPRRGGTWRGSVAVSVKLPERSSLRANTGTVAFRCDGRLDDVEVNRPPAMSGEGGR